MTALRSDGAPGAAGGHRRLAAGLAALVELAAPGVPTGGAGRSGAGRSGAGTVRSTGPAPWIGRVAATGRVALTEWAAPGPPTGAAASLDAGPVLPTGLVPLVERALAGPLDQTFAQLVRAASARLVALDNAPAARSEPPTGPAAPPCAQPAGPPAPQSALPAGSPRPQPALPAGPAAPQSALPAGPLAPPSVGRPAGAPAPRVAADPVVPSVAREPAALGVAALRFVLARLAGRAPLDPGAGRAVYAAAAELAEVTGWLLFDAERYGAAVRAGRHALRLARLAGDRSMELFTLHNLALLAGWVGRPGTELRIARAVLDQGGHPPRVAAVFTLRAARGLAGTAGAAAADRAFDRARALLAEGERGGDPPWVWWLTDQEIDGHQGAMRLAAGDWRGALAPLHRATGHAGAGPVDGGAQVGYSAVFGAWLLTAVRGAGDWAGAERLAGELVGPARTTGSRRARTLLHAAVRGAAAPGLGAGAVRGMAPLPRAASGARDALEVLAAALAEGPGAGRPGRGRAPDGAAGAG